MEKITKIILRIEPIPVDEHGTSGTCSLLIEVNERMRVLILSVGGSDVPLVKCIKQYQPDYVVFLCTDDAGTTIGSRRMVDGEGIIEQKPPRKDFALAEKVERPNIVTQCHIDKDQYEIRLVPHDDPYKNYEISFFIIEQFLNHNYEVIVDYTGGTKSMSVGLAAAAMEFPRCNLSVVKGKRLDLVKVRNGMERVSRLSSSKFFANKQRKLSQSLVKTWDYSGAVKVLEEIDRSGYIDDEEKFERMLLLCRSFEAWDKFDYWNAVEKINIYKDEPLISGLNRQLKQICVAVDWYKNFDPGSQKIPPVFILVYDVLLNAWRRASQGNYDDAVARIYRALEMYGQFCLRSGNPKLASENIDVSLIPEQYRKYYESKRNNKGKVQIGLKDNYDLLCILDHPVKPVWEEKRETIISILEKRNNSFLAHGMEPIKSEDFFKLKENVWDFINKCDQAQGIKQGLADMQQLPTEI